MQEKSASSELERDRSFERGEGGADSLELKPVLVKRNGKGSKMKIAFTSSEMKSKGTEEERKI